MLILTLIFLAVMSTGIYAYWRKTRPVPTNRYRRKIPAVRSAEINVTANLDAERESDEALGIKIIEKKPVDSPISTESKPTPSTADCVIVLYLMAPEGTEFSGYELLQALLSSGMRYGKQRIFNRHAHKDGRGEILFHCASATAPGTFDLTKMGAFSCKGLSFFFSAADVEEPLSTLDCLLETIDQLVEDLGGRVLDDHRVLFTKEKMVHYRQKIRAFENSKVTPDMFA